MVEIAGGYKSSQVSVKFKLHVFDINLKQSTSTLTGLPMCKKTGGAKDYRLFAIAIALSLAMGVDTDTIHVPGTPSRSA